MSTPLVISGPAGKRRLRAEDLPLRIGRGARMELRVPGPVDDSVTGLISVLEGRPLLQKLAEDPVLLVNGEPSGQTRWLADGDVVTAETLRIECHFDADAFGLTVAFTDTEYPTLPPAELPGRRPPPAVRARSMARAPGGRPASGRRLPLIYGTLLLLAAMAAWFFLRRG